MSNPIVTKEILAEVLDEMIAEEAQQPTDWAVYCPYCDWKGMASDCDTEQDYESWEMSHITWTNFICPKCGEITEE